MNKVQQLILFQTERNYDLSMMVEQQAMKIQQLEKELAYYEKDKDVESEEESPETEAV